MITFLSKKNLFILAFFLSFIIWRLAISALGFHVDLLSIVSWGRWIYQNSPQGFYENTVWVYSWPTQLPFTNLMFAFDYYLYFLLTELFQKISYYIIAPIGGGHLKWWYDFVIWFYNARYLETDIKIGSLISFKLLAILADVIIGWIIFKLAEWYSFKKGFYLAIAYLAAPFSWYLSSFWGQHDQLGFLFLLLSFLALFYKRLIISVLLVVISINIKPTAVIFLPLFIFLFIKEKPKTNQVLIVTLLSLSIMVLSILLFNQGNIIVFTESFIYPRVILKSDFRVSTNAFNFWHVLIGNQLMGYNALFVGISAKIWGFVLYAVLNIMAFSLAKSKRLESLFAAIFLIGAGSWLFVTNMLERYFLAGVVSLLILSIYRPALFKYWLIVALIFSLNLYHGWWFPPSLTFLKEALLWQDGLITRILALLNVLVFCRIIWLLFPSQTSYLRKTVLKFTSAA